MALKRDIRKELEQISFKETLNYSWEAIKILYSCSKAKLLGVIFLNVASVICPVFTLLLLQKIINTLIDKEFPLKYLVLYAIISLITYLVVFFKDRVEATYQYDIKIRTKTMLVEKANALRIEDFENKELHNTAQRAESASTEILLFLKFIVKVLTDIVSFVSYTILLVMWKWWIIFFILIIPLFDMFKSSKILKENFIRRWEMLESSRKLGYFRYLFSRSGPLDEMKMLNTGDTVFKRFVKANSEYNNEMCRLDLKYTDARGMIRAFRRFLNVGLIFYLVYEVFMGRVLFGNFNTYRAAFSKTEGAANSITFSLLQINIRILEIREFIVYMKYDNGFVDGDKILDRIDEIEFKNVFYKYKTSKTFALDNISFKIKKGEKIAVIGEMVAGKQQC